MSERQETVLDRIRTTRSSTRGDRYPLFLLLLVFDVVLLLVIPANSYWLLLVAPFVAGTLLLGLYTSQAKPRTLRIATIAGVVVVTSSLVPVITREPVATGVVWLMLGLLVIATPWSILRHIFTERTITLRTLFAGVSIYLLIGLAFAFMGLGVQAIRGVFFAQSGTHSPADFVYFSYIAMTTVGFGDLTPAPGLPRALVVPEVLMGQIFLVTTVARLVSMYGMPQMAPPAETPAETLGDDSAL